MLEVKTVKASVAFDYKEETRRISQLCEERTRHQNEANKEHIAWANAYDTEKTASTQKTKRPEKPGNDGTDTSHATESKCIFDCSRLLASPLLVSFLVPSLYSPRSLPYPPHLSYYALLSSPLLAS